MIPVNTQDLQVVQWGLDSILVEEFEFIISSENEVPYPEDIVKARWAEFCANRGLFCRQHIPRTQGEALFLLAVWKGQAVCPTYRGACADPRCKRHAFHPKRVKRIIDELRATT